MGGPSRKYYYIVLACGLALDAAWLLLVDTQPYSDFEYYHNLAIQIAGGGQWGDTYTSIGYPLALAVAYKLLGASLTVGKLFNLGLSLVNGLLLMGILLRVKVSESVRKPVFALVIFFPATIYYNSVTGTEILFTTVLLGAIDLYLSSARRKYIWIGVLAGLGAMIKPFFLGFFVVIFLSEYLGFGRSARDGLSNCLIVLGVSLLVVAPLIYRNSVLMGQFTYVSNNGGIVFYINNNSTNSDGKWMPVGMVENSLALTPEYGAANPTQRNNMLTAAARNWILSHPGHFLQLGFMRLMQTYYYPGDLDYSLYGSDMSRESISRLSWIVERIRVPVLLIGYLSMLAYGVAVVSRLVRGKRGHEGAPLLLLATFGMFASVYFITGGQSRYSFPTFFITAWFCVNGIFAVWILSRAGWKKTRRTEGNRNWRHEEIT